MANLSEKVPGGPPADWAKRIIRHRDLFKTAALFLSAPSQRAYYLVMYAVKSPERLVLLPMVQQYLLPTDSALPPSKRHRTGVRYRFKVDFSKSLTTNDLTWASDAVVSVLPAVVLVSDFIAETSSSHVPLDRFLRGLPEPQRRQSTLADHMRPAAGQVDEDLIAQYPVFAKFAPGYVPQSPKATSITTVAPSHTTSHGSASSSAHAPGPSMVLPAEELDPDLVAKALDAVEEKKKEWAEKYQQEGEDFIPSLLGGLWTSHFKGVPVDRVLVRAVGPDAKAWCFLYGLKKSKSWSINKYGEEPVSIIALEWCARMQYYYNLWYSQPGTGEYEYTEADHDAYVETWDFRNLQIDLPLLPGPVYARCADVKAIRPYKNRAYASSSSSSSAGAAPASAELEAFIEEPDEEESD